MRTVVTEIVGKYQLIRFFDTATIDPFSTARENKLVYFAPKPGEFFISEDEHKRLSAAMDSCQPGEVVTREGDVISIVETMTVEEIAAAKQDTLDQVLLEAARQRSQLEIKGDLDALAKSQNWYQEKLKEIDRFYGGERGDHE